MNEKHKRFVAEYLKDLNATAAAKRAGDSAKTAHVQGAVLLKNPKVSALVAKGTHSALEKSELSAERTLEEMRRLAFSNVQDLYDEHGDMKPLHTLTRAQAACIAGVEMIMKNATAGDGKVDRVLKIKIWDKPKTIEMLGKYFRLLEERIVLDASEDAIALLHAGRARAAKDKK